MRIPGCLLLAFAILAGVAHGEPPKLRVGIFERPPFVMKDPSGRWAGLAVEVWEHASAQTGLPFEYIETPEDQVIPRTASGALDLVVGEIGISADREQVVDFTQPYLTVPAAVAVRKRDQLPHWVDFFSDMLSHGVMSVLAVLAGTMLIFALLLWIVERRAQSTHFGGRPWHGLGSAIWFAAVTMTTVGYGDKTPQTPVGRVLVFFLMFLGVVIVSAFTGTVASSITLARSESLITRAADLARYRNGVLEGSLAKSALTGMGIPVRTYPTVSAGLRALEAGEITAFVGGEADLRYEANQNHAGEILVLPFSTTHINYAFATRPNLPQREAINVAIVDQTSQPGWERQVERWIGPPARR
jgi:ABC-type amino acid transport substrate-binding protein